MKDLDAFNKTTIRVNEDQATMLRRAVADISLDGMTIYDVMNLNGLAYELDAALEIINKAKAVA